MSGCSNGDPGPTKGERLLLSSPWSKAPHNTTRTAAKAVLVRRAATSALLAAWREGWRGRPVHPCSTPCPQGQGLAVAWSPTSPVCSCLAALRAKSDRPDHLPPKAVVRCQRLARARVAALDTPRRLQAPTELCGDLCSPLSFATPRLSSLVMPGMAPPTPTAVWAGPPPDYGGGAGHVPSSTCRTTGLGFALHRAKAARRADVAL